MYQVFEKNVIQFDLKHSIPCLQVLDDPSEDNLYLGKTYIAACIFITVKKTQKIEISYPPPPVVYYVLVKNQLLCKGNTVTCIAEIIE